MKLLIKKKYFDRIKSRDKNVEYRDAHITFICEETGEKLRKEVKMVDVIDFDVIRGLFEPDLFEDDRIIKFYLK